MPGAAALSSAELMDGARTRHKLEAEELRIIKFVGGQAVLFLSGLTFQTAPQKGLHACQRWSCPALEVVRIGLAWVLSIVEKPLFFVSWNPRWLIVDFCVPGVVRW